ncbi:fibronectin type III domain-containing protein [Acetivibrio saccincola]|uniref:Ferrous iron transporter A n=1 Tax=Acetivibrio saccincola TaxID=1677857 RepID=A0A2S8R7Y4_9FIRM|nr:fibronectin type III domain-containing protein [Acetivibrio saccincola]PQQ65919.1 ferrous iron transporter A [Acetivibrio saccincola]
MKNTMKLPVAIIILSLLLVNSVLFKMNIVHAAEAVNIYVEDYSDGVLTIRWIRPSGTNSFKITYHTPSGTEETIESNEGNVNTYKIEGLQNDFIYDIKVEFYNGEFDESSNQSGEIIGEGLLYFLPRISFYASRANQEKEEIPGGGYQIGHKPRLNLEWAMPKVWTSGGVKKANESDAINSIKNNLSQIYGGDLNISSLDFKINISTDSSNLNSGPSQASVNINYDGGYTAHVAGNEDDTLNVEDSGKPDFLNFDIIGRSDLTAPLPKVGEPEAEGALPHKDILPGTVYYMNIKPEFKDSNGNTKSVISVGKPSDFNGSRLAGEHSYTYTPIRFELSKDSDNNIYVKIYRVNEGSLDLPRLFYEVQSSVDPSIPGDWPVRKTINDTFFTEGAKSAITVISGVNPDNQIYYKIVVKTDGADDRIESLPMDYTLKEDTSKPPVPREVTIVDRKLVSRINEESGEVEYSTDVTISWAKPHNWDEIKANTDPDKDIVFHFMLNTHQSEIETGNNPELIADGKSYGQFPLKYRRVLSVSSKAVRDVGNRLEYTIEGFNLFKYERFIGMSDGEPQFEKHDIQNEEGYPDFLLPNTVYYLQMFTTGAAGGEDFEETFKELEKLSDKSVIVSFTTRSVREIDVPLPINLRVSKNDADVLIDGENIEISNYIEMQFDKVNINWSNYLLDTSVEKKIYYDIYMSTRPDINSFKLIGTTEDLDGDLLFIGVDDPRSTSIKFTVREFSQDNPGYAAFGKKLRPNTTYYFIARTRLSIKDEDQERERLSEYTPAVSVTTVKGEVGDGDESAKRPLAPTDFAIALDEEGNPKVSGSSVEFAWMRRESNVIYNIICTARRVEPNEGIYSDVEDAIYQSFMANFGEILLDPLAETPADNFVYDPLTEQMKYIIDKWLFPNRLYYFSIRAIDKDDPSRYSVWVSIPVTTSLIEQPEFLEAVTDVQLGFFFDDHDIYTKSEDYTVYIKSDKDLKLNLLTRDKYTIVKTGTRCYVRMVNLKPNSYYDVRVYKNNGTTLVYTKDGFTTRDAYHNVEVKWRGIPEYKYEFAIKAELDDEYTVLTDANFERYIDENGRIRPYYGEKSIRTSGTQYVDYYARIKTIPVETEDGDVKNVPLSSNTKYHIKVRAVREDPVDKSLVAYSKYAGPVQIRTDFNQEDYDEEDTKRRKEAMFYDKIDKLEEALYWRVDIENGVSNKILIKRDRMVNAIENNINNILVLDISKHAEGLSEDIIYIPVKVIEALDASGKGLCIKTAGAEYTLRPGVVDTNHIDVKEMLNTANINDIYYKLNIRRLDKPAIKLSKDEKPVSIINKMSMDIVGTTITSTKLEEEIYDRMYNKSSGIVARKLNEFLNTPIKGSVSSKEIEDEVLKIIEEIEYELSKFLKNRIEGTRGVSPVMAKTKETAQFEKPIMVRLVHTGEKGLKIPYVSYNSDKDWNKVSNAVYIQNSIVFNVFEPGEFVIIILDIPANDVYEGHPYSEDIRLLLSKYDLREVFGSLESFYPKENVRVNEIILLYEVVTEKDILNGGLNIRQRAQKYNLEDLLNSGGTARNVNRQETARVIMMVYSDRTNLNLDYAVPSKNIYINDENKIHKTNYGQVLMALDLNIFTLNEGYNFEPDKPVTRGEIAALLVKTLKLTGDM